MTTGTYYVNRRIYGEENWKFLMRSDTSSIASQCA
jgi:hypothetical protein